MKYASSTPFELKVYLDTKELFEIRETKDNRLFKRVQNGITYFQVIDALVDFELLSHILNGTYSELPLRIVATNYFRGVDQKDILVTFDINDAKLHKYSLYYDEGLSVVSLTFEFHDGDFKVSRCHLG